MTSRARILLGIASLCIALPAVACGIGNTCCDVFCAGNGAYIEVPTSSAAAFSGYDVDGPCTVSCNQNGENGCEEYLVLAPHPVTCTVTFHLRQGGEIYERLDFVEQTDSCGGYLGVRGGFIDVPSGLNPDDPRDAATSDVSVKPNDAAADGDALIEAGDASADAAAE